MHTRQRRPGSRFLLACILFTSLVGGKSSGAWGQSLPTGRPICLTVQDNHCQYVLPTPRVDEKFLLILGSLSMSGGPYRVTIQTEAVEAKDAGGRMRDEKEKAIDLHSAVIARPSSVILHHSFSPRSKSSTSPAKSEEVYPPAEEPARTKTFFLFVYVDRDYNPRSRIQPTVDDIIQTFDREVYPRACHDLGRALDVDRDGRFTILLTAWLGKLADGKISLGGFVRGSDFFRDLAPPFGNRCDMMYLNTELQPGPALRTILAHEYTHAVIFSEHLPDQRVSQHAGALSAGGAGLFPVGTFSQSWPSRSHLSLPALVLRSIGRRTNQIVSAIQFDRSC